MFLGHVSGHDRTSCLEVGQVSGQALIFWCLLANHWDWSSSVQSCNRGLIATKTRYACSSCSVLKTSSKQSSIKLCFWCLWSQNQQECGSHKSWPDYHALSSHCKCDCCLFRALRKGHIYMHTRQGRAEQDKCCTLVSLDWLMSCSSIGLPFG